MCECGLGMSFAGAGGAVGIALSFFTADQLEDKWGLHTFVWSACWFMAFGILATGIIWILEIKYNKPALPISPSHSLVQHDVSESAAPVEMPYCEVVKSLSWTFWVLTLVASFGYAVTELFNGNLTGYVQDQGRSFSYANNVLVVGYMSFIFTGPVLGALVDRVGHFPLFLILSNMIKAGALVLMMHPNVMNVYISVFIFMIGFSAFNAGLWPSLQRSIPKEEMMGRAFGFVSTMQNIIILLGLIVGGYLLPPNHSWNTFMWYCFMLAMICLVLSLFVAGADLVGNQELHQVDSRRLSFSQSQIGEIIANSLMTRSPVRIRTPKMRTPKSRGQIHVMGSHDPYNDTIPISGQRIPKGGFVSSSAPTH